MFFESVFQNYKYGDAYAVYKLNINRQHFIRA